MPSILITTLTYKLMKKGIDKTFMDYGIHKEDLSIVEAACELQGIDPEWLKEYILHPYNLEKSKSEQPDLKDKEAEKIISKAIEQIK